MNAIIERSPVLRAVEATCIAFLVDPPAPVPAPAPQPKQESML